MNALTAVKGATAWGYAKAIGDTAPMLVQHERLAKCRDCFMGTVARLPVLGGLGLFCGVPVEERPDAPLPTCGCLCGRVADATGIRRAADAKPRMLPYGAVTVGGKSCWMGRW